MITLTQAQVHEVADHIVGTTKSITQGLQDCGIDATQNDLSPDSVIAFDELIFCCDTCGWTCDIDEMSGKDGQVCVECADEEDDD